MKSKSAKPKPETQKEIVARIAKEIAEKGFIGRASYFPVAVAAIERGL